MSVAEVMVEAALGREESRGAHYRKDFPEQDRGGAALGDGGWRPAVCGLRLVLRRKTSRMMLAVAAAGD